MTPEASHAEGSDGFTLAAVCLWLGDAGIFRSQPDRTLAVRMVRLCQRTTAHHMPVAASEYTVQMLRDTLENWQSEFLQLIW